MTGTMAELAQNRSFDTMIQAVTLAKRRKASLQQTIQKYVHCISLSISLSISLYHYLYHYLSNNVFMMKIKEM